MCDLTSYLFSVFTCIFCVTVNGISGFGSEETKRPVITEHPLDVIIAKSEPATLNCAATGPDVRITWYKDDKPVITNRENNQSHRLILENGSLFLLRVNAAKNDSDAGTYYCVARNGYGSARSNEASLKIAVLAEEFRTRPKAIQAILGQSAVLECSPPFGFPEPVVTWQKDNQDFPVHDNGRISLNSPGHLVFKQVDRKDAGTYSCVATNMVAQRMSGPVKLSVYEKPVFNLKPGNVTVEVNETARFPCQVSGDPMPSIVFKKRDGIMPPRRAYLYPQNDGLAIERVQVADAGEYICTAKNPAGSIETSARLEVVEQPDFLVRPDNVTVEIGGTAKFRCKAKGHPTPALFWSLKGQEQDLYFPGRGSADGRIKVWPDGQLVIQGVKPSDAGYYTCSTLNVRGSNLAKAALKIVSKTLSKNPPPIIIYGHANQTLTVGSWAVLPCQATGNTTPQIDWLKFGVELRLAAYQFKERFNQTSTGSLQIAGLRKEDSGIYTCQAKNADGETTWTASLSVEDHKNTAVTISRMSDTVAFPSAPGKPLIVNATDDVVCLEWSIPESFGATSITGYMMQYFSPEISQTWYNLNDYIPSSSYCVKGLKSSHSYVFIVRAENSHGLGPPSPISDVAHTSSSRLDYQDSMSNGNFDSSLPLNSFGSRQLVTIRYLRPLNSTAVEVSWKAAEDTIIDGYYVQWRLPGAPGISYLKVGTGDKKAVVNGLKPFTRYEFFVTPFSGSEQGRPSNSQEATTEEAPPSEPPAEVRVRMMNMTTLRISWRMPPQDSLNGICIGYQVSIEGEKEYSRNIATNERAASVTVFRLEPNMSYTVKVAARNKAGIGVFRQLDPIVMNEATLQEHKRLMHSSSGVGGILLMFEKPWFIPVAAVFIWLVLVAIIAFIYWKWRSFRGKTNARLGMPFIKINDGSVHMTARDAMWMDHPNFSSTQRSLLLNGVVSNGSCGGPPAYTQTPHHSDYYVDGQMGHGDYPINLLNTINRSQSPNHYHYASLAGNPMVPTFCGSGNQIMDDPSPYATTTLVMSNRRKWIQDNVNKPPVLPSNPVPSGPPPRYLVSSDSNTMNGRRSVNLRSHPLVESRSQGFSRTESPPHTDVSYVQSSDGTGGSSNGRNRMNTLGGRRTPPKQTLMDFLPPPPSEAPPPDSVLDTACTTSNVLNVGTADEKAHLRLRGNGLYDAVSENLLCENDKRHNHGGPLPLNRPNSRLRSGYRSSGNGKQEEDDSQRSSLMMDENGCSTFCSSSEADEENSGGEDAQVSMRNDVGSSLDHVQHRPLQPCMGVSASALSQSSYDGCSARRSISRLKQPPQRGVKNELV